MPDTIRTLSELNTLFADNTTNNITAQELRDLFQSLLVHAQIGVLNNAGVKALDTSYAGNVIDIFNQETHARHLTTNLVTSSITIPAELTTGKYNLSVELQVDGPGSDSGDYTFALFKNGVTKITSTERKFTVAGTVIHNFYWQVLGQTLAANDEIQLAAISDAGTKNLLIVNGGFSIQRLGIE